MCRQHGQSGEGAPTLQQTSTRKPSLKGPSRNTAPDGNERDSRCSDAQGRIERGIISVEFQKQPYLVAVANILRNNLCNRLGIKTLRGASLVAQWLRICLLMQGTRVRALVWEDPTCCGATRPVSHNY